MSNRSRWKTPSSGRQQTGCLDWTEYSATGNNKKPRKSNSKARIFFGKLKF
jgi:hypothetical protein